MVQQVSPRELAQWLENGRRVRLVDVRQPWENEIAALPGSLFIPLDQLCQRTQEIERDTESLVVIFCHHGIRSMSAAQYLERIGFAEVHSLAGGIDAWSCEVDPAVPRY